MSEEAGGNAVNPNSMSIIVTKGSLDWAYPPFILSTTAAAMGLDVTMFFTFYGLPLLLKKLDLKVTPLGNTRNENAHDGRTHGRCPIIVSAIPGVDRMASRDDEESDQEKRRCFHRRFEGTGSRGGRAPDRVPDDPGSV